MARRILQGEDEEKSGFFAEREAFPVKKWQQEERVRWKKKKLCGSKVEDVSCEEAETRKLEGNASVNQCSTKKKFSFLAGRRGVSCEGNGNKNVRREFVCMCILWGGCFV